MWTCVNGLVQEIKKCEAAGTTTAAIALAFVCIDTMAFLALPAGRDTQRQQDFIDWVNSYLKGHKDQPYHYRGIDVYGARCAFLHAYGSEADFHQRHHDAKRFSYCDGGKHAYDPLQDEHLVIIGVASFLNDVIHAVGDFVYECAANPDLKARVEKRLPQVLQTVSVASV